MLVLMTKPIIFVGGPLNGQVTDRIGEHWDAFRDEEGNPLSREIGDSIIYSKPADERRHYYMASMAGEGHPEIGNYAYVHMSLMDIYNAAHAWQPSLGAAIEAMDA
jgi:hypothetical protein